MLVSLSDLSLYDVGRFICNLQLLGERGQSMLFYVHCLSLRIVKCLESP